MPPVRARKSMPSLERISEKENTDARGDAESPRAVRSRKRAASLGGAATGGGRRGSGVLGEANGPRGAPQSSPKRRGDAVPRKSAIRATPQVFASPTELGPNPEREHMFVNQPSDIAEMVERTAREELGEPASADDRLLSPGLPNPFSSLRRTSLSPTKPYSDRAAAALSPVRDAHTVAIQPRRELGTAQPLADARKRRRVTFSARQEKTDFEQDEPTMSIRPAGGAMGSEEPGDSSEEVSMDLTTSSAGDESLEASRSSDASDTATMQMTEVWHGGGDESPTAERGSDMSLSAAELSPSEMSESMDSGESTAADDSAGSDTMDFTAAVGAHGDASESTVDAEASATDASASTGDASASADMDITEASALDDSRLVDASHESMMEMTSMWGRIAEASTRARMHTATPPSADGSLTPRAQSASRTPSPERRSPVRRQTMLLSPGRRSPARAEPEAPATPTRFRQSLRGGVPSPAYRHSPAQRTPMALKTPPQGTMPKESATARQASPSPRAKARRAAHTARSSMDAASQLAARPRSPFIHSMIRQRGARVSRGASPLKGASAEGSDLTLGSADESTETSFHMHLAEFLGVIGLKFHEDMTASRTRPVLPAELEEEHARRERRAAVSLVDHAKAAAGAAPMLHTLRNACAELKQHVEEGRERLAAMEADFFARPPAFVQEWGQLEDEDMRRSMKGQLNVHKQAARAAAMHDYYGWRTDMQFDEELVARLQRHRALLERDARTVAAKRTQLEYELLPVLRERHAQLAERVQHARQRQREIHECDKEELRQLHASIEEQDQILQGMRAKHADAEEQLARVRARVDEVGEKRAVTEEAIRQARAVYEQIQGCSPGEATRLHRRVQQLETLLQWRLTNMTSTLLQLTHAHALHVTLELDARRGRVRRVAVSPALPMEASPLQIKAIELLRAELKAHQGAGEEVPSVLRRISDRWAAARRLRAEVDQLRTHLPVQLRAADGEDAALELVATAVLARRRAKAQLRMRVDLSAPAPVRGDTLTVDVVYGDVHAGAMAAYVQHALAKEPVGALTDAVLGAIAHVDIGGR